MSPRRRHRVHRQYLRQLLSPAFALAAVALLEVLSWTPWSFAVPTTILLTAVVASTFVGGLVDGLISAGITAWYYSYLLSSPGMVFPYSHEALRRVLVFACSAPAVALMVGVIKQRAARVAAEAKRKERESSDAVFASLTWTRDAQKTGREAERRYRALFDASVMGILRGFRDGRPVECNEAFVRLLGYGDRADVMARNTRDFFAASADFERVLERLDSGGLSIEEELGFRRKDGEIRRMRLSARRLEEGAGLVIELGVVDVTPQHQAEARAAALEARMVAHEGEVAALRLEADALAQAMAHDLRAPVRRIDDLSQSLLVDYGLALDGDGRARLNRLEATNRGVDFPRDRCRAHAREGGPLRHGARHSPGVPRLGARPECRLHDRPGHHGDRRSRPAAPCAHPTHCHGLERHDRAAGPEDRVRRRPRRRSPRLRRERRRHCLRAALHGRPAGGHPVSAGW